MKYPDKAIDYLDPKVSLDLPRFEIPIVKATNSTLANYGYLVSNPAECEIEIVQWPSNGSRPVDAGTGNQGGTTSGLFNFWWEENELYGENKAVNDKYLLGWTDKNTIEENSTPSNVLLWHANYHPDGGQLFFPKTESPFIIPLALPGDNVKPTDFIGFYVEKGGVYIHPNVWHEAVFSLDKESQFFDKQGKVHARVSCNFADEFGILLKLPLQEPL